MISLRNDIYVHMVLAAQKYKTLKSPVTPIPQSASVAALSAVSTRHGAATQKIPADTHSSMKKDVFRRRPEKIDEKVMRLIENPQLHALHKQLGQLETQFAQLRATAAKEDVLRIEKKILLLEKLLGEKSYV